ncbi:hypothetical protein [Parvibaculum sp.]|uniref:hypothetical protein n=1 Tax=Parvibaculum sp. TaxID=2024848 RepID=UPI000C8F892A|nr:hypothetical protein [Parvibaculum sp.]MAB15238.1 hypothetical protein [Parvibaculum sp.]
MDEPAEAVQGDKTGRSFTWGTRFMQASPLGFTFTALLISLLVFASFLFCVWWNALPVIVTHDGGTTLSYDAWTAICVSLLWGAIFGLSEYTREADLADLKMLTSHGVMVDKKHISAMQFGPDARGHRRSRGFGAIGLAVGAGFYCLVYRPGGHPLNLLGATLTDYWFAAMTLFLFAKIFRSLSYLRVHTSLLLHDLDHRIRIDLFNIHSLDALGRIALRRALPWVVASAIVFLMSFAQTVWVLFGPLFIGLMLSAALVFGLPMWRMHVAIDRAKMKELDKLRSDIAQSADAFRQSECSETASRLAALIALEQRLERVREWPLDVSTVVRFGLYLALPLGSWFGGALVEKALDILTR